jgi:hypothetical protein
VSKTSALGSSGDEDSSRSSSGFIVILLSYLEKVFYYFKRFVSNSLIIDEVARNQRICCILE